MNPKKFPSVASSLIITAFLLFATFDFGVCRVEKDMMKVKLQKLGGVRDVTERGSNAVEMESLARFAVEEYNKKENALLKFSRLVKAKEQVVAGKMYYLTLEATDASGKIKVYETKVWVKPWMNFKQMQEFKETSWIFFEALFGYIREHLGSSFNNMKLKKCHLDGPIWIYQTKGLAFMDPNARLPPRRGQVKTRIFHLIIEFVKEMVIGLPDNVLPPDTTV